MVMPPCRRLVSVSTTALLFATSISAVFHNVRSATTASEVMAPDESPGPRDDSEARHEAPSTHQQPSSARSAAASQESKARRPYRPLRLDEKAKRQDGKRSLSLTMEFSKRTEPDSEDASSHPVLSVKPTPEEVNRCSNFDLSSFEVGRSCGSPLCAPCFDLSRCQQGSGPKIYVYDNECSLADSKSLLAAHHQRDASNRQSSYWREATWRAGLLADSYDEACVFVHVNSHSHDSPCAPDTPLWNGGSNHVMMDFSDLSRDRRAVISNSYAMEWSSNQHACYYRSGYDMSLPLHPNVLFPEMASTPPEDREYFLTFKGTLYPSGHGKEERMSIAQLHDEENGVVVALKCFEMHGEHLLPGNYKYCAKAKPAYEAQDFVRLMNTTFALVPAGRSPGTYRLGEVMSAGAIPVFIVRDWIRPYRENFDWPAFSFVFSPEEVGPVMMKTLRAVSPEKLLEMQLFYPTALRSLPSALGMGGGDVLSPAYAPGLADITVAEKSLKACELMFGSATNYSVIASYTIQELAQRLARH